MIAIIDYGMGNSASIQNMLFYLEVENVSIVTKPEELLDAKLIILPGVGSFDHIIKAKAKSFKNYKNSYSFVQFLRKFVRYLRSKKMYPM